MLTLILQACVCMSCKIHKKKDFQSYFSISPTPFFIQGIQLTSTIFKLELELFENILHINQEREISGILCYDIKYMPYSLKLI